MLLILKELMVRSVDVASVIFSCYFRRLSEMFSLIPSHVQLPIRGQIEFFQEILRGGISFDGVQCN